MRPTWVSRLTTSQKFLDSKSKKNIKNYEVNNRNLLRNSFF